MKYTAVIAAFNIDNIAVHNIDIAVAYLYPDIVPYIMLKHSVKNAFYSFAAEWLQNISVCLDAVACYCIFGSDSREYQQVIVALISEFSCNVYPNSSPTYISIKTISKTVPFSKSESSFAPVS